MNQKFKDRLNYKKCMNLFAKGQVIQARSAMKYFENHDLFNIKVIMKANLYILGLLENKSSFREDEVKDIVVLIGGISNRELFQSTMCVFLRNIVLILSHGDNYQLTYGYFVKSLEFNQSDLYNQSFFLHHHQNSDDVQKSPFYILWDCYLNQINFEYQTLTHYFGDSNFFSFVIGFDCFLRGEYLKSKQYMNDSIKKCFRIAECYNIIGICEYHLNNIELSMRQFENSYRISMSKESLFNMAELCGVIRKPDEQLFLLKQYLALDHDQITNGSISTLLKIAQILLEKKQYQESLSQYEYIKNECMENGWDFPTYSFIIEMAHVYNMLGDSSSALALLLSYKSYSLPYSEVLAHSYFLSSQYDLCEKCLQHLQSAEAYSNKSILLFLRNDIALSIQNIDKSRRMNPNKLHFARLSSLIRLSTKTFIRSGYEIWLTTHGFQTHHQKSFYQELLTLMSIEENTDQLVLGALAFFGTG